MNQPQRLLLAFAVACGLLAGQAAAQISAEIKAGSPGQAEIKVIDAHVSGQFARLGSDNDDDVRRARESLVNDARNGSAAYNLSYARAVNREAMAFLKKHQALRPRLNAAIVAARVAEHTQQPALDQVVLVLLKDESPAIKLWGLKGARHILPELVNINAHRPILQEVFPIVQKYPGNGAMALEAYDILTPANPRPNVLAVVVPELLKLSAWRCGQYTRPEGVAYPIAEEKPIAYLTGRPVWPNLNPEQQAQVMQVICTALKLGAHHGDSGVPRDVREQYESLIRMTGGSLFVAASQSGHSALADRGTMIARAASNSPSLSKITDGTCQLIKEKYPSVEEPAAVGQSAP